MRESVESSDRWPHGPAPQEGIGEERLAQTEPPQVLSDGQLLHEPGSSSAMRIRRRPDDLVGCVRHHPQVPRLEAGPLHHLGREILEALPVTDRPFQERVFDHGPGGPMVRFGRGLDGEARRQWPIFDGLAFGKSQHPTRPADSIARDLSSSRSPGRSLRHRHPDRPQAAVSGAAPASRRPERCRFRVPDRRDRRRRRPGHHPRARRSPPTGPVEDPDRAGADVDSWDVASR